MEHILVCWIDEVPIKFTVMERKHIVDGAMRLMESRKLLQQIVTFNWNRKLYRGKIMRLGEKSELEKALLEEASKRRLASDKQADGALGNDGSRKRRRWEEVLADSRGIRRNLEKENVFHQTAQTSGATPGVKSTDQRQHYDELKKKYEALEAKYKLLQEEHLKCSQSTSQGKVDIGNSVMVDSAVIAALKTLSGTRNIFARSLFRAVFSPDELVGRSLTGKKCNANSNLEHLASVDASKRDAVIAYSLSAYHLRPGTEYFELAKKNMMHSLSNLMTEINTDAKKQEQQIQQAQGL